MGIVISIDLNLSHANEQREDHILASEVRNDESLNHFWSVVYNDYYRNDIEQTGNDLRFRSHHPWVDPEFRRYDREHHGISLVSSLSSPGRDSLIDDSVMPLAVTGAIAPASHSTSPDQVQPSAAPEPSGLVAMGLGLGLVLAWMAWRRRIAPSCAR